MVETVSIDYLRTLDWKEVRKEEANRIFRKLYEKEDILGLDYFLSCLVKKTLERANRGDFKTCLGYFQDFIVLQNKLDYYGYQAEEGLFKSILARNYYGLGETRKFFKNNFKNYYIKFYKKSKDLKYRRTIISFAEILVLNRMEDSQAYLRDLLEDIELEKKDLEADYALSLAYLILYLDLDSGPRLLDLVGGEEESLFFKDYLDLRGREDLREDDFKDLFKPDPKDYSRQLLVFKKLKLDLYRKLYPDLAEKIYLINHSRESCIFDGGQLEEVIRKGAYDYRGELRGLEDLKLLYCKSCQSYFIREDRRKEVEKKLQRKKPDHYYNIVDLHYDRNYENKDLARIAEDDDGR